MSAYVAGTPYRVSRPSADPSQWLSVGIMWVAVVMLALSRPVRERHRFDRGSAWETSDFIAVHARGRYYFQGAGVGRHRR